MNAAGIFDHVIVLCVNIKAISSINKTQGNSVAFSPQANYTDRGAAAYRRS
jgi:hypothetical protein